MKKNFRNHHLLQILESLRSSTLPLDIQLANYFRTHRALGSQDRREIGERLYLFVRWRALVEHLTGEELESIVSYLDHFQPLDFVKNHNIPLTMRLSVPESFFNLLCMQYGEDKAIELSLINNSSAPTVVRANPLKISREALLELWQSHYKISATSLSAWGICFEKREALFSLEEFKKGYFEMQDEASQLIAAMVKAEPGQNVLDFCAGSGGKSLAFAPQLEGKGQIYLHDNRPTALLQAKLRLRRAGVQNAQIISAEAPHLQKLKRRMDWVLVDAPCSGTGTWRRNPDMKWKFSLEALQRTVSLQRHLFEKALSFLKPGGHIVYSTCSILAAENEEQCAHFLKHYPLQQRALFTSLPSEGGMDGFYGVTFEKL